MILQIRHNRKFQLDNFFSSLDLRAFTPFPCSVLVGSTTLDRKRIYTNRPSSYPNSNTNPKAQLCFWTGEMMSFFDQVYRYHPSFQRF